MTVQVDESVINEGLLNRPIHFIVCIDTSLGADRYGQIPYSRTNNYVYAECSIRVLRCDCSITVP